MSKSLKLFIYAILISASVLPVFVYLSQQQVTPTLSLIDPNTQVAQVGSTLTNGLVAHYKFDEGSGTTATDSAGSNSGTLTNGPSWTTGKIGNYSLAFDGVDDKVTTGADYIGTSPVSISGWMNVSGLGGSSSGRIVDNGMFTLRLSTSNRLAITNDNSVVVYSSTNAFQFGSWVFFVVTRNSSNQCTIYINGQLSSTADQNCGMVTAGSTNVIIGNRNAGGRTFNGNIDDLRIYNRVLMESEILELYAYTGVVEPTPSPTVVYTPTPTLTPSPTIVITPTPTPTPSSTPTPTPNPTPASPLIYYIDYINGNDSNDGVSIYTPWKSIEKVNSSRFVAGDKILFKRGVSWTGSKITVSYDGSIVAPIVYGAYGTGERPIIDCNSVTDNCIELSSRKWITIEHMHFKRALTSNIRARSGSQNISIVDTLVEGSINGHGITWDGIGLSIRESQIFNNGSKGGLHGIYLDNCTGSASNILIEKSQFYNNGDSGIKINSCNIARIPNITIRQNLIYNHKWNGIDDYASSGANIYYNIFYSDSIIHDGATIRFSSNAGTYSAINSKVYNNVFHHTPLTGYPVIHVTGGATGHEIKNNIFYLGASNGFYIDVDSGSSILASDYNDFFGGVVRWDYGNVLYNSLSNWRNTGFDVHSKNLDPSFVSITNRNYSLISNSANIDAGTNIGIFGVTDFIGNAVPFGSNPDIGSYEYTMSPTATPVASPTPSIPISAGSVNGGGGSVTVNSGGGSTGGSSLSGLSQRLQNKSCVSATVFYRTLKFGSIGTDVKELQIFLNSNGYLVSKSGFGSKGNETTYFGQATMKALAQFQSQYSIYPSTGNFDVATLSKINSMISNSCITNEIATTTSRLPQSYMFTRSLKLGSTGTDVKYLQIFLNDNGYIVSLTGPGSKGNESTYFGPATAKALTKYQEYYAKDILTPSGLMKGTGYFGPSTMKKVNGG